MFLGKNKNQDNFQKSPINSLVNCLIWLRGVVSIDDNSF